VAAGEQVTMPAQDRVGSDQQPQAPQAGPGKLVQQRGQPRPVGRVEPYPLPVEVALQHRELVPEGEDLRVLVPVAAGQQPQQRERVRDPQVRQPEQHEPTSSRSHQQRMDEERTANRGKTDVSAPETVPEQLGRTFGRHSVTGEERYRHAVNAAVQDAVCQAQVLSVTSCGIHGGMAQRPLPGMLLEPGQRGLGDLAPAAVDRQ
jgi:hypothetical protein